MPVTAAAFARLALALPDVTQAPHFDRTAFRTPRRIFTTLASDGRSANLKLEPDLQAMLVAAKGSAFLPVAGKWGQSGWTTCSLARVSQATLKSALREAHALSQQKR